MLHVHIHAHRAASELEAAVLIATNMKTDHNREGDMCMSTVGVLWHTCSLTLRAFIAYPAAQLPSKGKHMTGGW